MAHRQFRGGRGKRESLWIGFNYAGVTQLSGGVLTYVLNAAGLVLRPFTIIRTHMDFMLISDQAVAIENQACAFGLAVVSEEAVAVGVTAIPTPVSSNGSDLWFLYQVMFAKESNLTDRSQPANFYSVDSKAMRKVEDGSELVGVSELSIIADGAILFSSGRMLVKTH